MSLSHVKNVLIGFAENDEKPSAALSYGLSLARQAGAHVTALSASLKLAITHAFVSEIASGLLAEENRRVRDLAEMAAQNARQEALIEGVPCTVETLQLRYAELVERFSALCRVHDFAVVDADPNLLTVDRSLIEQALFSSGHPAIVVPAGFDAFRADRIVIAWDGSAKAARAVQDALPFLRGATAVDIVCVSDKRDLPQAVPGAELAPHLARHGIAANVIDLPVQNGDIAETIRNHAVLFRADMIVMGAYVHSRLRQMVLGGVTQSLLRAPPAPLFLSY
jgi:nucleotide-binding universal stress UspA family protein